MTEPIAYLNGRFVPVSQAVIPVHDAGFVQGVTVAEQLRTFRGRLFRLQQHLQRLHHSLEIVGVDPRLSCAELAEIANELAARNHALLHRDDDLGLAMFVTPGAYPTFLPEGSPAPTVGMHTVPLSFRLWSEIYERGQSLIVSDVRQVPPACWPPELKCRSRMHYYLADRQARLVETGARALLLDLDGYVSESATANVVVYYEKSGLISPPPEKILPGISIAVLKELAQNLDIRFSNRELTVEDVAKADEVFLTSTSPCLLPVVRLNGSAIGCGFPGNVFQRLLSAWSELVGVDIKQQAARFSRRS
jgi:branched-subunit amino acid aminotransferase/4-amino-4-deoxychorismate lyase